MANVDWDPDRYLAEMLADIPGYLELQDQVAAATEGFLSTARSIASLNVTRITGDGAVCADAGEAGLRACARSTTDQSARRTRLNRVAK